MLLFEKVKYPEDKIKIIWNLFSIIWEILLLLFKRLEQFISLPKVYKDFFLFTPALTIVVSLVVSLFVFDPSHSYKYVVIAYCSIDMHCLKWWIDFYLVTICMSSLDDCSYHLPILRMTNQNVLVTEFYGFFAYWNYNNFSHIMFKYHLSFVQYCGFSCIEEIWLQKSYFWIHSSNTHKTPINDDFKCSYHIEHLWFEMLICWLKDFSFYIATFHWTLQQ